MTIRWSALKETIRRDLRAPGDYEFWNCGNSITIAF